MQASNNGAVICGYRFICVIAPFLRDLLDTYCLMLCGINSLRLLVTFMVVYNGGYCYKGMEGYALTF